MQMRIGAEINPSNQQFSDVKIGDNVPIEMPAWHWIEIISEMHTIMRMHDVAPSALFQTLSAKVFEALTPEEYRKSMLAEYAEVAERVANPYATRFDPSQLFGTNDEDED